MISSFDARFRLFSTIQTSFFGSFSRFNMTRLTSIQFNSTCIYYYLHYYYLHRLYHLSLLYRGQAHYKRCFVFFFFFFHKMGESGKGWITVHRVSFFLLFLVLLSLLFITIIITIYCYSFFFYTFHVQSIGIYFHFQHTLNIYMICTFLFYFFPLPSMMKPAEMQNGLIVSSHVRLYVVWSV